LTPGAPGLMAREIHSGDWEFDAWTSKLQE
jgi:hypothetical protein